MSDELASLEGQLKECKRNLRLIRERKAEYVLSTDIPLQLKKEERETETKIAELKRRIAKYRELTQHRENVQWLMKQLLGTPGDSHLQEKRRLLEEEEYFVEEVLASEKIESELQLLSLHIKKLLQWSQRTEMRRGNHYDSQLSGYLYDFISFYTGILEREARKPHYHLIRSEIGDVLTLEEIEYFSRRVAFEREITYHRQDLSSKTNYLYRKAADLSHEIRNRCIPNSLLDTVRRDIKFYLEVAVQDKPQKLIYRLLAQVSYELQENPEQILRDLGSGCIGHDFDNLEDFDNLDRCKHTSEALLEETTIQYQDMYPILISVCHVLSSYENPFQRLAKLVIEQDAKPSQAEMN